MKKDGSSSVHLGVTAALGEYFVSTSEKGGYTENHADVPVIFSDKGIDLAVQMCLISGIDAVGIDNIWLVMCSCSSDVL